MKYLTVSFYIFSICLFAQESAAREFTHFEYKPSLVKSQSLVNILDELYVLLEGDYERIGREEVNKIIEARDLGGGVKNFGGFSWYKSKPNFDIKASRSLAPELNSTRWIVDDSLTIYIDASTLLTNLRSEGVINITDSSLALFAGISFSRKYHYYHLAATFEEGLKSDFSKLFMSFTKFKVSKLVKITKEELLTREDQLSMSSKFAANIPATPSIGFGIAGSAKMAFQNKFSYQRVIGSKTEVARLSSESTTTKALNSKLSLHLDFLGLLKETLLSYEISYSLSKSTKSYLSLSESHINNVLSDQLLENSLSRFSKGETDLENLKKYLVSFERRQKENVYSKFNFLLFGSLRKKSFELVNIVKDGEEKSFYKSNYETVDFNQSLFSRIFKGFINRFFKLGSIFKNNFEVSKSLSLEYEVIKNLDHEVPTEESLSISFSQVLEAENFKKSKYLRRAIDQIKNFTNLPDEILDKVRKKEILAPMRIETNFEVSRRGIAFFNSLSKRELYEGFFKICRVPKSEWIDFSDDGNRRSIFQGKLTSNIRCAKKGLEHVNEYLEHLGEKRLIHLPKLNDIFKYVAKKSKNYQDLILLFGDSHVFIHGELSGRTQDKKFFQTFFKSGHFQEYGVIDRYKLQ